MKTELASLVASVFASAVFAYDWPADSSGCAVLSQNDTGNADSSFTNGDHWLPTGVPSPEYDYWVPSDRTIFGPNAAAEFGGKSLTLAGTLKGLKANATIGHLRLLGGSEVIIDKDKDGIVGEITVESTPANPAMIKLGRSSNFTKAPKFTSTTAFVSDTTSVLEFHNTTSTEPKQYLFFNGCDMSGFFGAMNILRDYPTAGGWLTNMVQGTITMPGSYRVGEGVLLYRNAKTASLQVGGLTLDKGSRISNMGTTPFVTVSDSFAAVSDVEVHFSDFKASTYGTAQPNRPVLTLKDAAAQDAALPDPSVFRLVNDTAVENNFWGLGMFGYDADGDDRILCYRDSRPLVEYVGDSKTLATSATSWENGEFPTGGQNGYVASGYFCVDTSVSDDYRFPGGGLVFKSGYLRPNCATMAVSNLFISSVGDLNVELYQNLESEHAAQWQGLSLPTVITCDYLGVYGNLNVACAYGREAVVNAPLYGSGDVTVSTRFSSDSPRGGCEFVSINTNWFGKFTAHNDCDPEGKKQTNTVNGTCLRLYMTDARNVGGALDAFAFDAFRLRGNGLVIGRNSLTFDQPNRGIFVEDRMRFVMTNETSNTLAIENPVTFGGELVFGNDYPNATLAPVGKGGGLLRLGGAAKFYDAASGSVVDAPVGDAARLTMLIGKLQVSAPNALDGVAVTFGAESDGLVVDWTAAEDVKARGLVNMKAAVPFVTNREDGRIPVSVVNLPEDLRTVGQVAVCTVPTEQAAEISGLLKAVKPRKGVRLSVREPVDNGDGSSTIFLEVAPSGGLVMLFR